MRVMRSRLPMMLLSSFFSEEIERIEGKIRKQAENGKYQVEVGRVEFAIETLKTLEECGYIARPLTDLRNGDVRYSINWAKGGEQDDCGGRSKGDYE